MSANVKTISPQQRALNFGAMTRQHIQTLGTYSGGAGSHFEFEIPKARLLAGINLLVDVEVDTENGLEIKGTNDALLDTYNVLSRISIDYNNGFSPVVISGKDMAVMNMLRVKSDVILPSAHEGTMCTFYKALATDGSDFNFKQNFGYDAENDYYFSGATSKVYYRFKLEIPVTLNDRDPAGLCLAQNGQTLINVTGDIANTIFKDQAHVEIVKITPEILSYSIPQAEQAFPDLSVLKITDSRTESFMGGGSTIIKLPTGMIYRKLIFKLTDEQGNPITPEDITSNIELIFNTADIPYSVNPQSLRYRSVSQTGGCMPEGYYVFDFSCQGTNPNYSGSRDYIDAESITTFETRFTSKKSGKITIISEKISRLKAEN